MTVSLLALNFNDLTLEQAAARIATRPADAPFTYVVTPNADHLARLARAPDLRAIYQQANLCLLDSRIVSRLALLLGLPSPRVVTGSDLTAHLLRHHLAPGECITIIGMHPDHVARLQRRVGLERDDIRLNRRAIPNCWHV